MDELLLTKEQNGTELLVRLEGRLDTSTYEQLETELEKSYDTTSSITLNMEKLIYLSSAGIRTIITAYKAMMNKDGIKIKNVNDDIMEILKVTGFADFLTIE